MVPRIPPARLSALRRRLLGWWDVARRELPWRFPAGQADPYAVWISEAMLQQTQVATVIPYFHRFLARFPTLEALASAEEEGVLAAWSGLGYYTRARSLHRAAREALARHGGLPGTLEALRALPGFGPYTAGAVASIAFGLPAAAVDGNAARVLSRLLLVADEPHSRAFRERVWGGAAALVGAPGAVPGGKGRPVVRPGDLNQALIELGALVCRPGTPRCERCPVESLCEARKAGRERSIPARLRRTPTRRLVLAVAVCVHRGRVLLVRRPDRGLFAGMWSPPATELRDGERPDAAISSVIRRELSATTGGFTDCGTVERLLTHRLLELRVLRGKLTTLPRSRDGWRLVTPAEASALAIPEAMRRALAQAGVGRPEGGGRHEMSGGVGKRRVTE